MSILDKIKDKVEDIRAPRRIGIYATRDSKTGEYNSPYFQPTDAAAIRLFRLEINRADTTNLLYNYPEDFELYRLGSFNLDAGEIRPELTLLAKGPQLKS